MKLLKQNSSIIHPQTKKSYFCFQTLQSTPTGNSTSNSYLRIPTIRKLVEQQPKHTILLKTLVSQPTMTTQKIQTLMTGSEVFSSTSIIDAFFSSSVQVDNIISQISKNNGSSVGLGDETWGKLFKLSLEYPCVTTFDIWDWETCDNIIYANLLEEIGNGRDLTIGHFLALDHVGHSTSSISHQAFLKKKILISEFLLKIVQKMSEQQILLITGDHGMRDDGNHGGASVEETQSFLFSYSKSDNLLKMTEMNSVQVAHDEIIQPDVTATLSLLLNIPIPTNSIGVPAFVPQSYLVKQKISQILQEMYKNLYIHFTKLMEFNNIQCPELNQNDKKSFYSYFYFKNIQKQCLFHLSHTEINIVPIILLIFLLGVSCIVLSLYLNAKIIEYIFVILIATPHSFSWFFIRHSSTYYLACLFLGILIFQMKSGKKSLIALFLFITAQFQPLKNGEYVPNLLKVQFLSQFLYSKVFACSFCIFWILYEVKNTISQRKSKTNTNYIIRTLQLSIILLSFFSSLFKWLQQMQIVSWINITLTTTFLIDLIFCTISKQTSDKNQHLITSACRWLTIFMGPCSLPLHFLISSTVSKMDISKNNRNRFYLCFLLGHWIWWVMGNRYEYSSIDILQSYIFSTAYYPILNSVCLCVHMMSPYFVTLLVFMRTNQENGNYFVEIQNADQLDDPNNSNLSVQRQYFYFDIAKLMFIPFVWLICCFINLTFNHQKILYTVVYVPMTVIQVAKTFFILFFISLINISS